MDTPKVTDKKTFKYPQVSSELLATGNKEVLEFFESKEKEGDGTLLNFEALFKNFYTMKFEKINYTRAGYIQKVVTSLITKKPEVFAQYIFDHLPIQKVLIKHIYSKSVS